MHGQLASEPRNVFLDRERLVGRQPIEDQMQGLAASTQHPAQHVQKQQAGQGDRIGTNTRLIPERDLGLGSLGVPRKRGIRLTLPGLLRRQALSRQHHTNRGQAQPHAESLPIGSRTI